MDTKRADVWADEWKDDDWAMLAAAKVEARRLAGRLVEGPVRCECEENGRKCRCYLKDNDL